MDEGVPAGSERGGAGRGGEFRGLAVIAGSIGVLVALAAVAVLMLGSPRVASYPPGSAEEAFQRYVAAIDAGDREAAQTLLSTDALSNGRYLDLYPGNQGERRVWIDTVERPSTTRARLHVTVERTYSSGPVGLSSWRQSTTIEMVVEDGVWKLDSIPYEL